MKRHGTGRSGRAARLAAAVSLALLLLPATLSACEPAEPEADDFTDALPDEALLSFGLPAGAAATSGALTIEPAALVGDASQLYQVTRATRETVNAAVRELLAPLTEIARSEPPTSRTEDTWIWRVSPAGDPDRHALIIRRHPDGHFVFQAWSREKKLLARWRFRAYGTTTPGAEGRGRGALWVNLETDRKDTTSGKVLAFWEQVDGRREVSVSLYDASPDTALAARRTRGYLFVQGPAGGLMVYGPEPVNIHDDPAKDALEQVTLLSRWSPDGVGRTDVTARGGDVLTDGLVALVRTECWASPDFTVNFEATHVVRRVGADLEEVATDGDRAACPPLSPQVAVAPELVDEPEEPEEPEELSAIDADADADADADEG